MMPGGAGLAKTINQLADATVSYEDKVASLQLAFDKMRASQDKNKTGGQAQAEGMIKLLDQVDKFNQGLSDQVEGLDQNERALRKFTEAAAGLGLSADELASFNKILDETRGLMAELDEKAKGKKVEAEAAARQKELEDRVKRLVEQTRTPLEKYESTIGDLNELYSQGAITWDVYGRAVQKAREELERFDKTAKGATGAALARELDLRYVGLAGFNLNESQATPAVAETRTETAQLSELQLQTKELKVMVRFLADIALRGLSTLS
jgi:hypothetical protein